MSFSDARAAFELRVKDNFTSAPVAYMGVPFQPTAGSAWVRLVLLPNTFDRISLGPGGTGRERGHFIVSIFTPARLGAAAGFTLADELSTLFNEAQFEYNESGLITCRVPNLDNVGTTQDGNWYQVNLVTDYQRDTVLA